jgi:hypothetical protein
MAKRKTADKDGGPKSGSIPPINGYHVACLVVDRISDLLKLAFWFGGISALGYVFVVLPLRATAGKVTVVNFLYRMIFSYRLDLIVTTAAAAVFLVLWTRERKLHRDDVQRFYREVERLQKLQDPERSSSGLTSRGDPP